MTLSYRSPTMKDCYDLAANLRTHDRAEMQAARGGLSPGDLWLSCLERWHGYAVRDAQERLVCIFAVNPHHDAYDTVGVPWLLGTPLLDRHLLSASRGARQAIAFWHKRFQTLTNFTDERNTVILKWLRWLGFKFTNSVDLHGHTFIQFIHHV